MPPTRTIFLPFDFGNQTGRIKRENIKRDSVLGVRPMRCDDTMAGIFAKLSPRERAHLAARLGAAPWELRIARKAQRDAAIVDFAARHFAGQPVARQAREIDSAIRSTSYKPLPCADTLPPRDLDNKFESLCRVIDLLAGKQIGWRHVARILAYAAPAPISAKNPIVLRQAETQALRHHDEEQFAKT